MWGERCRDVGMIRWYRECARSGVCTVWGEGGELLLDMSRRECLGKFGKFGSGLGCSEQAE